MKILCKTCTHDSVCKHRCNYKRTIEALDTKVEAPFIVTLECPFYNEDKTAYAYTLNNPNIADISAFDTLTINSAMTNTTISTTEIEG